ncbi:hypothetical protein DLNHIDIE_01964 [Acidithiobacillus thiooxidans ATCC 19377]|uniref:Uncharacterized protein n=1 Tax=Acidithiobacillus thiooxidans ATCC 19377 TaxID=637390 RepID=A0A543Q6Y4_ACITH|nr:hypothetical protein DLNHIDIE_01964 [Acidithiobacillus thiooxidans ATCC 19377]
MWMLLTFALQTLSKVHATMESMLIVEGDLRMRAK